MGTLGVLGLLAMGLFVVLVLLLVVPKKKPAPVMAQVVPQFMQQPPVVVPQQPQLTLRQQQIQEKVAVLTSYYVDKEHEQFKKMVVDEALELLTSK